MKIYANLLGKWTELNDDFSINGGRVETFFEKLTNEESFDTKLNNGFVKVENAKRKLSFEIHYTCIQRIDEEEKKSGWMY